MSGHMERHTGRGMSGGALLHPPQVQQGLTDASAHPSAEDGARRLSRPCPSQSGHEVGGPRISAPDCNLPSAGLQALPCPLLQSFRHGGSLARPPARLLPWQTAARQGSQASSWGPLSVVSEQSCHPGHSRDPGAEPAGGVDRDH